MNRYVFVTLEWAIYIYIHRGSPYIRGVKLIYTEGHFDIIAAIKGPV